MKPATCRLVCFLTLISLITASVRAASLSGSFSSIPRNSVVNLSEAGSVDWVHWGLHTVTSLNRKSGVTPRIGNFSVLVASGDTNAFASAYQYADNYNGYSWIDGTPETRVTNTTTGVWCYGIPNIGTGFEFSVPADTTLRTLKVYVGAFAARGRFEATLSDGSAPAYVNTSLVNQIGNGPSGAFTINYAAASSGQTLRIRWTLQLGFRADANVTLQAAAMSVVGANNPPSVALTSPADSSTYAAPASITLNATASDFDGTINRVEFFADNQKLGQDTTSPYAFTWNSVQPGLYLLKALAYDNAGDVSESKAVEIFVHGSGGSLSASVAVPPSTLNLTAEGTADWAHWGLVTNTTYNHKAGVSQQIGNFTKLGNNEVQRYVDNLTGYSWSDGTPTASVPTNSHTGVFINGEDNGFALSVPADTTTRTLKVYVGLYGAVGKFQAYLSDFSAQAYVDMSLENVYESSYAVYTLTYAAASSSKTLRIRYRPKLLYDGEFGNVTLQAATLLGSGGANIAPAVSITSPTNNATFTAPANISIQASASDSDGAITKVEFFNGSTKLGEATSSPYMFGWNNVPAGSYTLTARATDDDEAATTSAPVNITVGQTVNTPPTVSITSPTNGTVFTAPATFTLQASASDNDGSISQVEFFVGSASVGVDASSPYSAAVSSLAAGNYNLAAVATDDDGAKATNSVSIIVNNPPTVSITSPTNNSVFTAPADVTLQASASDADGAIAKVEFYNGATKLGEDTSSPYRFNWNGVSAGSYSLTAKAIDSHNAMATSSPIAVIVRNPLSSIALRDVTIAAGKCRFSLQTESNWTYTVEFVNTLGSGTWEVLRTLEGNGTSMTVEHNISGTSPRFYRVFAR